MTEETTNLPVSWEEQMKADARAQVSAERPALAFMSLKGGIMMIGDTPVPNNELDCIVAANVSENVWYKDRYDPTVKTNPTCYAIGEGKAETLVPYDESKEKQSETCGSCAKFEWGSDPNGGRGKACKERRRLALVPADGMSETLVMGIPSTSLKSWANYVATVVSSTGMSTAGVITKIKVVPDPKNQFLVKFEMIGRVPDGHMPAVMAKSLELKALLKQPYPEVEEEEAKPAKKRKF